MIKNFADHAANERTFLAWVRTAIAVMAFGFLVERFDVVLELALPADSPFRPSYPLGGYAGVLMVTMGTVMVAAAAVRFFAVSNKLDRQEYTRPMGVGADIMLSGLLVIFGLGITVFLIYMITG
jgi:putative membrane protein